MPINYNRNSLQAHHYALPNITLMPQLFVRRANRCFGFLPKLRGCNSPLSMDDSGLCRALTNGSGRLVVEVLGYLSVVGVSRSVLTSLIVLLLGGKNSKMTSPV